MTTNADEPEAPEVPFVVPVLLTIATAAAIAVAEVDRLSNSLVDGEGRPVSMWAIAAPGQVTHPLDAGPVYARLLQGADLAGLRDWQIARWVVIFAVLDAVATICLGAVVHRLLSHVRLPLRTVVTAVLQWRRSRAWSGPERRSGRDRRTRPTRKADPQQWDDPERRLRHRRAGHSLGLALTGAGVRVRLVADLLLGVLAASSASARPPVLSALTRRDQLLAEAVGLFYLAGWVLAGLVAVVAVRRLLAADAAARRPGMHLLGQVVRSLYLHRFTLLAVGVLAALVLLPGGEILDQFPDVSRAWVDGGTGARHAVAAMVSLGGLTVVVFVVGRLRAARTWNRYVTDTYYDGEPADYRPWLLMPVVVLALAGFVVVTGLGQVDVRPLLGFVLPLFALVVASVVVNRLYGTTFLDEWFAPPREGGTSYALLVWSTGDVLAVMAVAVSGVGLVRAFTAPAVLGRGAGPAVVLSDLMLVLGFATAGAAWPLGRWTVRRLDGWTRTRGGGDVSRSLKKALRPDRPTYHGSVALVVAVVALTCLGVLAARPMGTAALLGVVAMTTVSLTCLVVLASLLVLAVQRTRPLPLFKAMRLKRSPVLSLVLVVPLVASLHGGDLDVHRVRIIAGSDPAVATAAIVQRPDLDTAFGTWLRSPDGCQGSGTVGGHPVRPMLLVAAAGGGIRAAVWTAAGLGRLAGLCGPRAVFLSSGVSGGSVGLTLARSPGFVEASHRLAAPTALSAAVDGLVVRDLLADSSGIRLDGPAGGGAWLDRAGLMERQWQRAAPSLARPFLDPGGGAGHEPPGVGGYLLLNSTSVGTRCRMIISDVQLPSPPRGYGGRPELTDRSDQDPDCHSSVSGLPAGSVDLLTAYGPCLGGALSAGSAAMLSARFPYVTPSGVIPRCDGLTTQQLVDGGYAESTGLGTLSDLAPSLARLIRDHNGVVLAGRDRAAPVVMPTVVFLQNHFGTDLSAPPRDPSSELMVPPTARSAQQELARVPALQQRLQDQLGDLLPCEDYCQSTGHLPPSFVVVAPATQPSVTAPLGWTLSGTSIRLLTDAMRDQAGARPAPGGGCPRVAPYGTSHLCDLRLALAASTTTAGQD